MRVRSDQLVRHDVLDAKPRGLGRQLKQRAVHAQDWLGVHLTVDLRHVAAVQVDGQIRHARDRAGVNQVLGAVRGNHAARKREVAVEPAGQNRPAVNLHRDLAEAFAHDIRVRLGHQPRRIGVGADHPKTRAGLFGHPPGDHGAVALDEVAAGGVCAVVKRNAPSKPFGLEPFGDGGARVERGGALGDEIDERLCHGSTL